MRSKNFIFDVVHLDKNLKTCQTWLYMMEYSGVTSSPLAFSFLTSLSYIFLVLCGMLAIICLIITAWPRGALFIRRFMPEMFFSVIFLFFLYILVFFLVFR